VTLLERIISLCRLKTSKRLAPNSSRKPTKRITKRRDPVHTQVINIVGQTQTINGVQYPVIDLMILINKGCKKVNDFILEGSKRLGYDPTRLFTKTWK
jgi:hypothetical protein